MLWYFCVVHSHPLCTIFVRTVVHFTVYLSWKSRGTRSCLVLLNSCTSYFQFTRTSRWMEVILYSLSIVLSWIAWAYPCSIVKAISFAIINWTVILAPGRAQFSHRGNYLCVICNCTCQASWADSYSANRIR